MYRIYSVSIYKLLGFICNVFRGLNDLMYFYVYVIIEYVLNDKYTLLYMLWWMVDLILILVIKGKKCLR